MEYEIGGDASPVLFFSMFACAAGGRNGGEAK